VVFPQPPLAFPPGRIFGFQPPWSSGWRPKSAAAGAPARANLFDFPSFSDILRKIGHGGDSRCGCPGPLDDGNPEARSGRESGPGSPHSADPAGDGGRPGIAWYFFHSPPSALSPFSRCLIQPDSLPPPRAARLCNPGVHPGLLRVWRMNCRKPKAPLSGDFTGKN